MSMITATRWVPKGYATQFPTRYVFDEDEYGRIAKLAKLRLDDAQEELAEAEADAQAASSQSGKAKSKKKSSSAEGNAMQTQEDIDDDLKEYDLEHYDDDAEPEADAGATMGMFANVKSLTYHDSNAEDPYITIQENEEEDEEREELQILPTDSLVLAARLEDEVAHLEVYVYESGADNLYVHHDIMLPAIPLCVEWLNFAVGKPASGSNGEGNGNFVAIGTMDPDIEVWDLDIVDCMYPNAILGQGAEEADSVDKPKKKKKKKRSRKPNDAYHVDAVLSLAANRAHRNLLASSSADATIKLWDLNTAKCAKSYTYHSDKVCAVEWNPREATVLLSGSYDRTVVAADMRAPDAKPPTWGVESDVETVRWNPHDPNYFYATTEGGIVYYHDARMAPTDPSKTKPVWTLQAHDEAVSSFDVNPNIPGFLATGSTGKEVKLWNVQASGPSMVVSRDLDVGKVFSTSFATDQDICFTLAVGGSKGKVQLWDTSTNLAVRRIFADRIPSGTEEVSERLVGLVEYSSDSESGEDPGSDDEGGAEIEGEDEDEDEVMKE
ncbi:WD40 repeat-like protein [Trichodelitschia bisporula]|uniref:WD40 repeat-like protein n=1 Tax=Trichodelitschia bisporula TaxID=703511 RepID=A0A6G1I608_9PEZI|nr:WD40 repeat-like protein [Trichodelitschia bisporula]